MEVIWRSLRESFKIESWRIRGKMSPEGHGGFISLFCKLTLLALCTRSDTAAVLRFFCSDHK